MQLDIDHQAVTDLLEQRFPCPKGANRIDWQRHLVDTTNQLTELIEYSSWDEYE